MKELGRRGRLLGIGRGEQEMKFLAVVGFW